MAEMDVGFSNREQFSFDKTNTGGKKTWQTIVKKIRAVSRVVNRRRAVKVIKVVRKPEAVKVSRADSRVARVVKVASNLEANRAVNRTGNISVSRGEFALSDQAHLALPDWKRMA
jgi:hypothetical protein